MPRLKFKDSKQKIDLNVAAIVWLHVMFEVSEAFSCVYVYVCVSFFFFSFSSSYYCLISVLCNVDFYHFFSLSLILH